MARAEKVDFPSGELYNLSSLRFHNLSVSFVSKDIHCEYIIKKCVICKCEVVPTYNLGDLLRGLGKFYDKQTKKHYRRIPHVL
jgi:hypothetical protein